MLRMVSGKGEARGKGSISWDGSMLACLTAKFTFNGWSPRLAESATRSEVCNQLCVIPGKRNREV